MALSTEKGRSGSPGVKAPSHSLTVNKQCLKSCLAFCSYGCYSSGRPASWVPGPFQALLLSALPSRNRLRTVDWAAGLLASSHALSWQGLGPRSSPLLPPCLHGKLWHVLLVSEAAWRPLCSSDWLPRSPFTPTSPTGQAVLTAIAPLGLHCQDRPARIPDHTGS